MEEIYTWNDSDMNLKLNKVVNLSARNLLSRLLSKDNRYVCMEDVLQDNFFNLDNPLNNDIHETARGIEDIKLCNAQIEEDIIVLKTISETTLKQIANSMSVFCNTIFEDTEVSTPTCFIILPHKINPPSDSSSHKPNSNKLAEAEKFMNSVFEFINHFQSPLKFSKQFIKEKMTENMYLYLIDEYTSKPICDPSGMYSIRIVRTTYEVEKILQMMMLGIQTMAVANTATGVASMLYPISLDKVIPQKILGKAIDFSKDYNLDIIKKAWEGDEYNVSKGGGQLRAFKNLLERNDPKRTFSNLKRVSDKNGNIIWVTEDSYQDIVFQSHCEELQRKVIEAQMENEELRKQVVNSNISNSDGWSCCISWLNCQ